MSEPPYRSIPFGGFVFQYGLFLLSLLVLGIGIHALLKSRSGSALIVLAIAACLLYVGTISRTKFGVVIADDPGVTIELGSHKIEMPWIEVTGLMSIPFVAPPVYRLTYRQPPGVTYFTSGSGGTIHIGIWSWGFSAMARYMRQRMRSARGEVV